MRIFTALLLAVSFFTAAQTPQVPHKMSFAGMSLTIRDDARKEIQKDVDALTASPRHFNIKAERAKIYFPVIEKILAEEDVPDDFKYLVLQESALIADAVSVSNAVGFWQFKDFTAKEMGLRVDKDIDERMNIAASTRGAARYIKKNNTFFDNWLYALQAYQMGAGGVMRSEKNTHKGEKHAEITSSTYWYVKKFLAHKVAFENVKGDGAVNLLVYQSKTKKSLSDFAKEVSADENELKEYNKWVRSGDIPDDRTYAVLIPIASGKTIPAESETIAARQETVSDKGTVKQETVKSKINGVPVIQALDGETPAKLATRAGVDLSAFLKWNDINYSSAVIPGAFYFLAKKRNRSEEDFHKLQKGETLWMVSQRYGVQLKKLKKYNRLQNETLKEGTMLWLSSTKPRNSSKNEKINTPIVEVDEGNTFNWSADPVQEVDLTTRKEEPVVSVVTDPISVVTSSGSNQVETNSNNTDSDPVAVSEKPVIITEDTVRVARVDEVPKKSEHLVVQGETLYAIAKKYNVSVMDLVNWNNLDLQQGIKPGQLLKLSENQQIVKVVSSNVEEIFHEVKPSDTLYSIARKYGVTIKDLMDWNQKKDFALSVGEKLRIRATQ
ncbi:LysM peptidoglycan-binding domain-containing protein [Chryseosolibacter indicus]|uniref:LysM peptidoglycan-binding domain-containing protein n=1 Tax=Chryseosolibacter indicus TaxID=2782351 RepID=A0ABS5VXL8_9BACT|nr:LysM peptidoglycan-binding domain-containing protein [Chryseosolibacter indicus]MBT1706168.1 LysM peptidoglycan-binding domain-containing protein [Chryseosolibacter indicus]